LDRAIKLGRFAKCPFSQILPCRRRHQMSIHDQDIAATVYLEKLDRASHHIGKRRLVGSRRNFVGKRQVVGGKKAQQTWLLPFGDLFQPRQIADHAKMRLIEFCFIEVGGTATEGDVDCALVNHRRGKLLGGLHGVRVGIERRHGRISQGAVCHDAGGATFLVRDLENCL
jgi:hypothetical protein